MIQKIRQLNSIIHVVFLICIIGLVVGILVLNKRLGGILGELNILKLQKGQEVADTFTQVPEQPPSPTPKSFSEEEIQKLISDAVATLSGSPEAVIEKIVEKQVPTQVPSKTYIPLGNSHSTASMSWVTLDDTESSIDLINDYGEDAQVSWECSLKVAHANGTAYARLWDDTNKIAVVNSELAISNRDDYIHQSSKDLILWRGRNIYKVQLKSLNGFEIFYTNGRIKINY